MSEYESALSNEMVSDNTRTALFDLVYKKMELQTTQYKAFLNEELVLWQANLQEIIAQESVELCKTSREVLSYSS